MIKKLLPVVLVSFLFSVPLSGCFDKREVDDLTYAIAIGFDKGTVNPLRMTIQYAVPIAIGGEGGSGGGGGSVGPKSVNTLTIETPTIFSGLNMINNFIGKQLNMSHAKVAVFSEEISRSGQIFEYIHAMVRGREFRPNLNIAVSRGSAREYIESIKPIQEANPAKYYELKFSTYKYTGFTADTQLSRFYSAHESGAIQPVATLVGVSGNETSKDIDASKSTAPQKGRKKPLMGDYLAGDIPKSGDIKGETLGLAVFKGNKMVGVMDGEEATSNLMVTGKYRYSFFTFPEPESKDSFVVLNLRQSRKPQYKVSTSGNKPKISLKLIIEGDYVSIQSGKNYEEGKKLEEFQVFAQGYLEKEISAFLNKTSKEMQSDICGFGRYAKGKFLTWNDWIAYKWFDKYKDTEFNVNVDFKVRRTGLVIRTIHEVPSQDKED